MKVPVLQTPEFVLYLEEFDGLWFIHCDVLVKWTKSVKSNLAKWFDVLTKECGKELYALHSPNDKKHERFLKMFDFSYLNSFKGTDGNNYDVYIWR